MPSQSFARLFSRRPNSRTAQMRRPRLSVEPLEARTLLATLSVDINDAACVNPGDDLYCEIQEAVDVASPGDTIGVNGGTYSPFIVPIGTDNLTIQNAPGHSPVVDGNRNLGDENGVELRADGVTIQGITAINASGTGSDGNGFLVTGDGNTLSRNTASSNQINGFLLRNSSFNTLNENIASGNAAGSIGAAAGIMLDPTSDSNLLVGNSVTNNSQIGIFVDGGSNTISANTATGNRIGFDVEGYFNTLSDNLADSNVIGISILGEGNLVSDNSAVGNGAGITVGQFFHTLIGNVSSGNVNDGYSVEYGEGHTLTDNIAEANGRHGFQLFVTEYTTLTRNIASDNLQDGFHVSFDEPGQIGLPGLRNTGGGNRLIDNTANGNGRSGFAVHFSNSDLLTGNTANGNTADGFTLRSSIGTTLADNVSSSNGGSGVTIDLGRYNTLTSNTADGNGIDGFSIGGSNLLAENTATNNSADGFRIEGSGANTLIANVAERNVADGFRIVASDFNRITDNSARKNGGYGFYVDALLSNSFSGNVCKQNSLGGDNQGGTVCGSGRASTRPPGTFFAPLGDSPLRDLLFDGRATKRGRSWDL